MQRGKKRRQNRNQSAQQPTWQAALRGLVLAWLITLAGLFIVTCLIYFAILDSGLIAAAAKTIMILSMAAGGLYVFRKTQGRDRIWVLIMLIAYLAVRFLLSVVLTFL